ncbi:MAG: hypothetical protein LC778_04605, partial [Acidobacteria bacterium]|nr:hypothetical protein [Acidobacteriota bacterium]
IAVAQLAGLPAKTISRAKEVLAKLEQYELAVFAQAKEKINDETAVVARAFSGKTASQFSLFAVSNEHIINDLRNAEIDKMTEEQLKHLILDLKNRLV